MSRTLWPQIYADERRLSWNVRSNEAVLTKARLSVCIKGLVLIRGNLRKICGKPIFRRDEIPLPAADDPTPARPCGCGGAEILPTQGHDQNTCGQDA
jgi:hypothetical protein